MASLFIFVVAVLLIPNTRSIEEEILECPTISKGYHHPYCECRYGPKYDQATNTCPNPECPAYNSTGLYPNCTCNHKNFDYSIYLNECFRVCPENSTGYWPQCDCDGDGYIFNTFQFECIACPLDSTGIYPKCSCGNDSVYSEYSNSCERCEGGSVGIYPNCTCLNDAIYDASIHQCKVLYGCVKKDGKDNYEYTYDDSDDDIYEALGENNEKYISSTEGEQDLNCIQCPSDSSGVYPNCTCEQQGKYIELGNYCLKCPWDSVGGYPNCTCKTTGTYINYLNSRYKCPDESTGKYPACSCSHPFQYENDKNMCVKCPENSSGIYPNCGCTNGFFSRYHVSCVECPVNSTGIYPACKCLEEGHEFSAFINECYIAYPENSTGKHPYCTCYNEQYYNVNEFICESNIGRKCPPDSIGIGPDCLCMLKEHNFNSLYWDCLTSGYGFSVASAFCPDNNGKWPQCEASIERNTLLSLIG